MSDRMQLRSPIWAASVFALLATGCPEIVVTGGEDAGSDVSGNQAPVFDAIDSPAAVEGVLWEVTVSATDPEGQAVTIEATGLPTGASFSAGKLSWTPNRDVVDGNGVDGGQAEVTITLTATDDGTPSASAETTLNITVLNNADDDNIPDIQDDDDDNDSWPDTKEAELGTNPLLADTDADTVDDPKDNCPTDSNPDQKDTDKDGAGDACDPDDDNDGLQDAEDNCPLADNPLQEDLDGDDLGNACDPDDDNDGKVDGEDNCPLVDNPSQENTDKDPLGNACDDDDDNDGVLDPDDNCPLDANPLNGAETQLDTDSDGLGDICDPDLDGDGEPNVKDNCVAVPNADQKDQDEDTVGDVCDVCPTDKNDADSDNDGVCDVDDNCPDVKNPDQLNNDQADEPEGARQGDVCDLDDDNDNVMDTAPDNCQFVANNDQVDTDGDGAGDACDEDDDGDQILDGADNCPQVPNGDQANNDVDEEPAGAQMGDACDDDDDNDGVLDADDNCRFVKNPGQKNNDGDEQGDVCDDDDDNDTVLDDAPDNCPMVANLDQLDCDGDGTGDACSKDDDNDGVPDKADNCICGANADQADNDEDGQGDVCDDDDDNDTVLDDVDLCPWVFDPAQVDVDGDGLSVVCDPEIAIPAAAYAGGAGVNVEGDARGGVVALQFRASANCAAGGTCANPGVFVIHQDQAFSQGEWATIVPAGKTWPPAVAEDGGVYLRAETGPGLMAFETLTATGLQPVLADALSGAPTFLPAPAGGLVAKALQGADFKLWQINQGESNPVPFKSGLEIADLGGQGPVRSSEPAIYFPVLQSDTKTDLVVLRDDGTAKEVLLNQFEVDFLTLDHATGLPWFCTRKFGGAAPSQIVRYQDGFPGPKTSVNAGCGALAWDVAPDGTWYVRYPTSMGEIELVRWKPVSGAKNQYAPGYSDMQVHLAGLRTFVTGGCPGTAACESAFVINAAGVEAPVFTEATLFSPVYAASEAGVFAAAYRAQKSAPADIKVSISDGKNTATAIVVNSSTTLQIKNLWITPDKVAWLTVFGDFGKGLAVNLYSAALVTGGGKPSINHSLQFALAGSATLTTEGGAALLSIDGAEKGLYRLSGIIAEKLDDALGVHSVLAAQNGVIVVTWKVNGSTWRLGSYEVASGAFTILEDALVGQPLSVTREGTGASERVWFTYAVADRTTLAYVEGGALTVFQGDMVTLEMIKYPEGGPQTVWGALSKTNFEDNWTWCERSGECWVMPTSGVLGWRQVSPDGTAHAVYFNNSVPTLWRNLDAPIP